MQNVQLLTLNLKYRGDLVGWLTLEITRLRASKTTRNDNAPPQAQPTSKKRRIAIRVH
jgi:hypothetical protein